MAKSKTEHQAARQLHAGMRKRLNMPVSIEAKSALEKLARYYGVKQRQIVERTVLEMWQRVLEDITLLTSPAPVQQGAFAEPGYCFTEIAVTPERPSRVQPPRAIKVDGRKKRVFVKPEEMKPTEQEASASRVSGLIVQGLMLPRNHFGF